MNIILFTTTAMDGARQDEVKRLFTSVANASNGTRAAEIRHYFLVQQCDSASIAASCFGAPADMRVSTAPTMIPLSTARNRMIAQAMADGIDDDALVMFPDDDAWFPQGTLEHIAARFHGGDDLDMWFCRYGEQARFDAGSPESAPAFQDVLSYASSNTIAVRGHVLKKLGGFDENLGLGTSLRSGEDTDFAIRAYFAARTASFMNGRIIGHRDFNPAVRAKYYRGSLVAIGRYAGRSPAAAMAFARKMAVGGMLCLKRELPIAELFGSWKALIQAPGPAVTRHDAKSGNDEA